MILFPGTTANGRRFFGDPAWEQNGSRVKVF